MPMSGRAHQGYAGHPQNAELSTFLLYMLMQGSESICVAVVIVS
jgi:hypothetical protein